jgi:Zn-dependent protease with chaperone function
VIIGAALLAYAACVGVLGPRVTRGATWPDRAPVLAIACYLTAAWSVIAATGLAGLALAVHGTALGGGLSFLVGACVRRLRDTYATPGGTALAMAGLGLASIVLVRAMATGAGRMRAVRRAALRHAWTARLVGRQVSALEATVVDDPRPAAYCLPGRRPTVVLTTGTLAVLNAAQLAAVLAHERAHLAGRHHLLMTLARTGRAVLPFIPLLREADVQVARLTELHADDAAVRACASGPLVTALVILATGGSSAPSMAAAATDVVQRVTRLLRPAPPLGLRHRLVLRAGVAALAISPVLLALTPALIALALGPVPAPSA